MNKAGAVNKLTRETIKFDKFLNISLGLIFILFSKKVNAFIFSSLNLKIVYLFSLGVVFIIFGLWQYYLLKNNRLLKNEVKILSIMAISPALILLYFLLFNNLFNKNVYYLLWLGDFYMLLIGVIYIGYIKN